MFLTQVYTYIYKYINYNKKKIILFTIQTFFSTYAFKFISQLILFTKITHLFLDCQLLKCNILLFPGVCRCFYFYFNKISVYYTFMYAQFGTYSCSLLLYVQKCFVQHGKNGLKIVFTLLTMSVSLGRGKIYQTLPKKRVYNQ